MCVFVCVCVCLYWAYAQRLNFLGLVTFKNLKNESNDESNEYYKICAKNGKKTSNEV